MRLLNRLGCRYLVRGASPIPTIEAPGADLAATTDWTAWSVGPDDAFYLADPNRPHLILQTEDGAVLLGGLAPGMPDAATWRLVPIGGGGFHHIVSVAQPAQGLMLGPRSSQDRLQHQVAVGPVGSNPATMWHVDPDACVRDARSLHLRYPASAECAIWYNEVSPRDAPPGTYFCTSGFSSGASGIGPSGYAGIQKRGNGSRIAIFSVWHRMQDETTPDPNGLATIITASPGAEQTSFAGEGSGQSIRVPFEWDDDVNSFIRFVVAASSDGNNTVLSAYVSKWGDRWVHMGTIRRTGTEGRLLTGLYAFIEDFMRNGNEEGVPADRRSPYQPRRACFANPWIGGFGNGGNRWLEPIISTNITAYTPHPLENMSVTECGAESNTFDLLAGTGLSSAAAANVLGTTITDTPRGNRPRPILPHDVENL